MSLRGQRFGKLLVDDLVGYASPRHPQWRCRCDCGGIRIQITTNLVSGRVQDCGCKSGPLQQAAARRRYQEWRSRHPERELELNREWRGRNPGYRWPSKVEMTTRVRQMKSGPCVDCGQRFHFAAMDFDHVKGIKINNVGTMVSHGWSPESIEAEIAKCDLICSNCHRVRTWNRRKQNA